MNALSLRPDGNFRLPLFARAGAVIPEMLVDDETMNALGQRQDGSRRDELIVRVYANEAASGFTLYEDDGVTTAYEQGAVRTTQITQQRDADAVRITIDASSGTYDGAPDQRNNVVELFVRDADAVAVDVNGQPLSQRLTQAAFDAADSGWYASAPGVVVAKSGTLSVTESKNFVVRLGQR
jgi:alpha-glucosidase